MRNFVFAILLILTLGCAQADGPVMPDDISSLDGTRIENTSSSGGKVLWGMYVVTLDPEAGSAEIVPIRGAAFKANVTQFLQPPDGMANGVTFAFMDFDDFPTLGIVELDVGLRHPFPGLDQFRGFDVMGLFLGDGSFSTTGVAPAGVMAHGSDPDDGSVDPRLLNADGYTRWNNPTEFSAENIFGFVPGIFGSKGYTPEATVNGYKYFAHALSASADVVEFFTGPGHLEFRGHFIPGTVNWRHYKIQFIDPASPLMYQYAIIASWEPPSTTVNPGLDDFSLLANQQEAFLVAADTSESTVYYESPGVEGGTLVLDLTIYDWQALEGDDGGVSVPDSISHIWLESFTSGFITGAPLDILPLATASTDGLASSTFSVDLASVDPSEAGFEGLVITIESADPTSYDQGYGAPVSSAPLAAYQVAWVEVQTESPFNQAPSVGEITGETEPLEINIELYQVAAYDPESNPLHYEWSLVDLGLPADWTQTWPDAEEITVNWADYGPGDYDLHCRVKDDFNDWQLASNSPLSIVCGELTITCGNGEFGYFGFAWSQNQATECAFLSNGTVVIEHGYSFTPREFQLMIINYEWDIPAYCYTVGSYDLCDDDWCEDWDEVYIPSTDPANRTTHMDSDPAGTWGDGTETDDVIAFVMQDQANIVRFIGNINTTSQTSATQIAGRTVPYNIIAMDFDEDGDLWVLDANGDCYELTASTTYALGAIVWSVDMDTVAPGSVVVFDWVVSYLIGDLYIFTDETVGGTIHRISGSSGAVLDTISNALDAGNSNPAYGFGIYGARGDIEIDHRIFDGENPLAEHCRLVVSGGPGGTGQAAMFARYDQTLTLLSTWDNNQPGGGTCNNPPSNDGGRFIIFDPIDHVNDPGEPGDEESWDHTMWVGDAGTSAGNMVWVSDGRPAPDDWDGWG